MTSTTQHRGRKKQKENALAHAQARDAAFNEQEFRELVQKVQLRDIFMRDTRATLTSPKEGEAQGEGSLIVNPIQTRTKRVNDTLLYCGVRFDIVTEDCPEFEFKVSIFAEYGIFYEIPADIVFSKQTAAVFARRNAVFNAWPFFRELVHTTVGRMGIPPIILPTFRLPAAPP